MCLCETRRCAWLPFETARHAWLTRYVCGHPMGSPTTYSTPSAARCAHHRLPPGTMVRDFSRGAQRNARTLAGRLASRASRCCRSGWAHVQVWAGVVVVDVAVSAMGPAYVISLRVGVAAGRPRRVLIDRGVLSASVAHALHLSTRANLVVASDQMCAPGGDLSQCSRVPAP